MPAWVVTVVALAVVAVGIAVAYRMYGGKAEIPSVAPAEVSVLTTAARSDLYGDAFNEEVFMRPGAELTDALVEVDNAGVDGSVNALAALVGRTSNRLRETANRLRPQLRPVDADRRGTGGRGDPGGAAVVNSTCRG